jgi:hypothetical protein
MKVLSLLILGAGIVLALLKVPVMGFELICADGVAAMLTKEHLD